ncbi:primary replicative DNA helicase [Siphonobacter aquaeclarae]|uniref:Replicative DNA helicase n=3 Tax=Bacteria TaxID=2 RepID=A0A1G9RTS7_9BACT|nr:primary replicative DNA helicase [Siphonobacter aquaeclarae]
MLNTLAPMVKMFLPKGKKMLPQAVNSPLFLRIIVYMEDNRRQATTRKSAASAGYVPNGNRWLDTGLGKIPPQAIELEEAVLGAVMLERDALTAVVDILKPESFYREAHQKIFTSVLSLFNNSEPVDLLTVTQRLRNDGTLEFAGGAAYLAELTSRISSAANVEAYARKIAENSIKRDLITSSNEVLKLAYEDTTDVFQLLDKAEQDLFKISESNIRKNFSDMNAVVKQALEELEAKKHLQDGLTGVASGFTALDRVTGGWQKSELVIIAARPAMGKTAFILSACRNAAVDWNQGVAIFSLEMSSVQLVNRLISAEAEIESEKIKKGSLANHEWAQLHARISKLTSAPIFIDDTPALSILELRAKCRRLKQQHDIQLIVIDYLQLMQGDSSKGGGNREQEIASISRALKNLAKELNVPVIALSQLSRAVETRGGEKKPQLSDLRESGSIEQDADMVMFLYRPEYYGITQDENGQPTTGVGEVIIGKNRSGSTETVQLRFINKFTKFADLAGGDFSAMNEGPRFSNQGSGEFIGSFENQGGARTFGSKVNQQTQAPPGDFGSFSTGMGDVPF